jgi:hypothetical protein
VLVAFITHGIACRSASRPRAAPRRTVLPPRGRLAELDAQRPWLLRLAHGMMGLATEDEDVVDHAWLR